MEFQFLNGMLPVAGAINHPTAMEEPEFVFKISESACHPGHPQVRTVRADGVLTLADWRRHAGAVGRALRLMEQLRRKGKYCNDWGAESWTPAMEADVDAVDLWGDARLVSELAQCPNLVSHLLKPISVLSQAKRLRLVLEEDASKMMLIPSLQLPSATSKAKKPPLLLSADWVLKGTELFPMASLGDNFQALTQHFLAPLPRRVLSEYLSLLLSYISNIDVICDGKPVQHSDKPVVSSPTLVIEKVDADRALYLRVGMAVGGLDPEFMAQFPITRYVGADGEGQLRCHPVETAADSSSTAKTPQAMLMEMLRRSAPSKAAIKEVYSDQGLYVVPESVAGPFLLKNFATLCATMRVIGAEKLREYRIKSIQPKLKFSLASGIDFLEGEVAVQLDQETMSLGQMLAQYAKQRYVELVDGQRALLDENYMRRLQRIFHPSKNVKGGFRISFFDLPEVEDMLDQKTRQEPAMQRPMAFYSGFALLAGQKLDSSMVQATLRPYQSEGVKWLKYLHDNGFGGCLADDMGLGKTLQTITLLAQLYPQAQRPTLIVMPRSLLFNWQQELERFAPQLAVATYYGPNRVLEDALKAQVVLTSYAVVRNDIQELQSHTFEVVILDESQNIKTITTQTSRAVCLLSSAHRYALSGTPLENNLMELYSLFRFLNPAMFGPQEDFVSRYLNPIQNDDDSEALADLRRRIFPFMLRRLKSDVLTDLPERISQTFYVEMEPDHASFYEQRRSYYKELISASIKAKGVAQSQMEMFRALTELRRIASVPESLTDGAIASPKLGFLAQQITELAANGHKTVVFFNFIAGIELLGEMLESQGLRYGVMTGATNDRRSVVERFQNDAQCQVLLMTLKTGGVGLNLTAADTVFIVEPWWNHAAQEQAINRLHRIGQKQNVLAYSMITRGTIEEKIQLLQQKKAELFDSVIASDNSISKSLSADDINFILS